MCSVYERVHLDCVELCIRLCTDCVCECLRVVKLAETARAAHRFSRLHHSSLGEEWLCTMPAVLPSGLDSLYSLLLCVSITSLAFLFSWILSISPQLHLHSYTPLSCSLFHSPGNTMMIIVESMSNGALDSFLRVSFFPPAGCCDVIRYHFGFDRFDGLRH